MSTMMEEKIKRWTAKCKNALIIEMPQGKTTVPEVNSQVASESAWWRAVSLVLALMLLAPAWPAVADIYKCRTADGRTEISNIPCSINNGTLSVRPDDTVPDEAREQAQRDVERMRGFVDRREAAARLEAAAEQQRQAEENQAEAARRIYAAENMDDCLAELGQWTLPAPRRAELEAICRAKVTNTPAMVGVPVYGGIGNPVDDCVARIMRLRLAPAEQQRRIAQCRGVGVTPPARPPAQPPKQAPVEPLPPCPRNDRHCVR
ncbi:DUF4124 domain-containing protein [Azonexus sp.]|jgi:hypothetical protein|uniref:DUF4124 domain-containing protein n=1 Tax=Azonexus sp. TaxID=1872668 RepID=UPI00281B7B2D|nr:DUF4124 domain-containing protein [Azonexus sp.]MDR1995040.1 DUF4124 domain-containing protein [Azonexus sp.]